MSKQVVSRQAGFTIVELMIATTVLSVILLIATLVMTSIGGLFTKGINESNIQDASRNIVDDVSQSLELNKTYTGPVVNGDGSSTYCIASTRYTVMLGKQLSSTTNDPTHSVHVLWRDSVVGSTCDETGVVMSTDPAGTSGSEMVPPGARLTQFSISNSTSPPYSVTVRIAYGTDDLLCSKSVSGDCTSGSISTHLNNPDLICKSGVGSQFCSWSSLTTTVVPRILDQ